MCQLGERGLPLHLSQSNKSFFDKAPAQHFGCPKEGDSPGHALLPLCCEALATWAAQNNPVSPSCSGSCESAVCETLAEPSLLICLSFSFSPDANAVSSGPTRSVMGQLLLESLCFPGRVPSRDGHWGDLVGNGLVSPGGVFGAKRGTRALLGGHPARRMQLSGLHSSCAAEGAFPCVLAQVGLSCHPHPCSSPAFQAQTGAAPPGLLLGWVSSVPRLCAPSSMDSSWCPRSPGPFGMNSLQLLTSSPLPLSPQECHH